MYHHHRPYYFCYYFPLPLCSCILHGKIVSGSPATRAVVYALQCSFLIPFLRFHTVSKSLAFILFLVTILSILVLPQSFSRIDSAATTNLFTSFSPLTYLCWAEVYLLLRLFIYFLKKKSLIEIKSSEF